MSSIPSPASLTDVTALLAEIGVSAPLEVVCTIDEAMDGVVQALQILPGSRVVLKVVEPHIAHKTESGAVRIVDRNELAIAFAIDELALHLDARRIAICEYVEHDVAPGGELLLAMRWTEELGPIVTFGLGGTAAELLSSVVVLAPGLTRDPLEALRSKPFAPLITGFRNQRPHMTASAVRTLLTRCLEFAEKRLGGAAGVSPPAQFGGLKSAAPLLREVEINPLVSSPRGLIALDVLIDAGGPAEKERDAIDRAAARPIWKVDKLLHPSSVGVMGVSATSLNAGRIIARNARPNVTIVKAAETQIDGIPCVPDLDSLPPVDLLVLAIAAEQVPDVVDEIVAKQKAESVLVIPGGLGEHEGSASLEERVRRTVADSRATAWRGPVLNGANCLGVRSPAVNTIFLPKEKFTTETPRELPLAIVSQSGALAASLQTKLAPFEPRYVISIGNQLDLTAADYLRYFDLDGSCDVLAFYVEGFEPQDGRRFFENAAAIVASGRTVILYRAGRTPAGQRATSSHTASIAGDVVVARELAAATGVLFAETLDEFEDLIRVATLLRERRPRGRRLGVMSNAGFETVAVADNHGALDIASLTASTSDAIGSLIRASRLDRIVTVANPLDVNPMLGDAAFLRIAELLIADENVDVAAIGCIPLTGALRTLPEEILSDESIIYGLAALWHATEKPWVVTIDSGALYDAAARRLTEEGVPVFRVIDRAARALARWSATLARS